VRSHRHGRANLSLTNGRRRLDVHDHRMLQIDEIIASISITGDGDGRSGVAGSWIVGEIAFGSTRVAPSKAGSSGRRPPTRHTRNIGLAAKLPLQGAALPEFRERGGVDSHYHDAVERALVEAFRNRPSRHYPLALRG
jgi:hypothetical protein